MLQLCSNADLIAERDIGLPGDVCTRRRGLQIGCGIEKDHLSIAERVAKARGRRLGRLLLIHWVAQALLVLLLLSVLIEWTLNGFLYDCCVKVMPAFPPGLWVLGKE